MSFLLVTLGVAVGVALTTGGRLRGVLQTRLRAAWVLLAALALQLLVDLAGSRGVVGLALGPGLLVASYVLLIGFCTANLGLRGMAVVAIGIALNATVITLNRGMPVRSPATEITSTVERHAERPSDRLMALADIIVVPPLNQALSFGDLIMVVGLVDVLVHRSRAPLRHRQRRRRQSGEERAATATA